MKSRFKIFSDPVHGFISVPRGLIMDLIHTPQVQRLRRIRQLGIGYLVFPGAEHSRFGHALGAMALMHDALTSLSEKGTDISPEEHEAALAIALLHDIGHGPYSHTLEHELISDFEHEAMSRAMIASLNTQLDNRLSLVLQIFDNTYSRVFFHQMISSQLDMDRLDYLRRDSYYTGVVEGSIGVDRIIKTLRIYPDTGSAADRMVVEEKGLHAVESFLVARRLMYWQVYLHKTVLAGDQMLRSIIRRARMHSGTGRSELLNGATPAFKYFLENAIDGKMLNNIEVQQQYVALDDTDIVYSLKNWADAEDPLLADLARRFLNRDFFRVLFMDQEERKTDLDELRSRVADYMIDSKISSSAHVESDVDYYLSSGETDHSAYERAHDSIGVLTRDGRITELSKVANVRAVTGLTSRETRSYISCPKEIFTTS